MQPLLEPPSTSKHFHRYKTSAHGSVIEDERIPR